MDVPTIDAVASPVARDADAGEADAMTRPAGQADLEPVSVKVTEAIADDRLTDASEILLQALEQLGPNKDLLVNLAWVQHLRGRGDISLELLTAAGGLDPSDREVVRSQARILVQVKRSQDALALLQTHSDTAASDPVLRAAAAETYAAMGMLALALDAFGAPRTLERAERRARRKLWWRTGGPLRFVRENLRDREMSILQSLTSENSAKLPPPRDLGVLLGNVGEQVQQDRLVDATLNEVEALVEEERFAESAELLSAALAEHSPNSSVLLRRLAWVEWLRGNEEASLAYIAQALTQNPTDVDTIRDQVYSRVTARRFREAEAVLDHLHGSIRYDPDVRVLDAELRLAMGLPAAALDAYGDPTTLPPPARRARHLLWWRTGGPLKIIRRHMREFDRRVIRRWHAMSAKLHILDQLPWPAIFDPAAVHASIDWHQQHSVLLSERIARAERRLTRAHGAASIVLTFAALWSIAPRGMPVQHASAVAAAAVGALGAFALYRLTFFTLIYYVRLPIGSVLPTAVIAGLGLLAGGFGILQLPWEARGWPTFGGVLLVAAAGMAASYFLLGIPILSRAVRLRRHWRSGAREDILDEVLEVLEGIADPSRRNDLARRSQWMRHIENAAYALERNLLAALHPHDADTAAWTKDRAQGAAAALRRLKRHIAAPTPSTWDQLTKTLQQQVVALAMGDLGRLRWTPPPTANATQKTRLQASFNVLRTFALGAAPLALVFVMQPLLQLDQDVLRWAKLIGLGWAVLYLLLAADPTLREKIDTTRNLITLISTARTESTQFERRDTGSHPADKAT